MNSRDSMHTVIRRSVCLLALGASLGSMGCAPDLAIKDYEVQWSGTSKNANATIINQGFLAAGPFQVYFTPEECPTSSNYRPQVSLNIPALEAGEEITTHAEFQSLARPENANLGDVYSVSVKVDPKDAVSESNEFNNWDSRTTQFDISGLTVHTYNEALATILRGIELTPQAAGELELVPGYYKISSHRVSGQPNEQVIALHIFRSYFQSATGISSPPRRDEPFVFSVIDQNDQYEFDSTGFRFSGRDLHGHTLKFEITFESGCHAVNSVELNCTTPRMTAQSFTTSQLYTCGVTSEPPWSDPLWQ